jgi:hypothetical protein
MEKTTKMAVSLLPNYFKKAGIAVMLLAFATLVIVKTVNVTLSPVSKEVFKLITMNTFILGLLFIAWAREKFEDELTIAIRQKSMIMGFIWGVLYVIIRPFMDMLVKGPIGEVKGQELVLSMLLVYLLMYFVQRKAIVVSNKN